MGRIRDDGLVGQAEHEATAAAEVPFVPFAGQDILEAVVADHD